MITQSTVTNYDQWRQLENEYSQAVVKFIRKWRLSQNQAASVLRVNARTVSRWLNGSRVPSSGYAIAVELLDEKWQSEGKPEMILW